MWSPLLSGVQPANYANLKADCGLSLAIGGATGAFVGTDVGFVTAVSSSAAGDAAANAAASAVTVDTNWLRPVVGIEDGTALLPGAATAGLSTSIGFTSMQMVENVVVPRGKCWVD